MASKDWLVGGGEMAKVIKAKDWSRTPLGPIESWPQSLRTVVSLMQASNSPISLAWGPGHTQIYNDGYWPICGDKHPTSMGQDFRECWAAPWPVIGEAYETALAGKTSYLEKMRMFLERYGFVEETWFTFSFSPITDETGGVGGLFHPVTEMTEQMLSERRTKTLRDLAVRAGKARTTPEAFTLATQVLGESDLDLPFVLFYALEDDEAQARLVGATGLPQGTRVSADVLDAGAPEDDPWRVGTVVQTGAAQAIDGADLLLAGMTVGPYPELPKTAFALPIAQPGSERPAAVMVAGVSARLRVTEPYRGFFELVAAAVSTALANARAYEEERRKAEALAEIDRAKTAFFSNVSHEFRTPLTLILGPLDDALSGATKRLEGESLESVHRNALRLLRLVNTLLDFSRAEASRLQSRFEPTDLSVLTGGLAGSFQSVVESAGLALHVDCPPLPEPVYVDRSQWEKIVLNLVSNAFKFTFAGEIEVRLRAAEGHVELSVRDTGAGIPAEELPKIFDRFHRVEGARGRSFEGTGIGLAMVHELVKQHGGSVGVESVVGRGSTFVVRIPRGKDHLPADRVAPAEAMATAGTGAAPFVLEAAHWAMTRNPGPADAPFVPPPPAAAPAATSPSGDFGARVLVADDNADMRGYLVRLLEARWTVEAVADGEAALAAALQLPPDLVLSDVMMPRMDGVALLQALRADAKTNTIPVVLLSARAGEEAVVSGLETGADDYLVKPFSARELVSRVATHLELARTRRMATAAATELAETRAALLEDLDRKNKELESFSYSVSHDLRAPLRAIDGFSLALLEEQGDALGPNGQRYLERVRGAARRMSELIDDLLKLSRVGRAELHRESVDLSRLARSVGDTLARSEPGRPVTFEVADGLVALADRGLVAILLENLLGNAWKFTAKTSAARVAFGSRAKEGQAAFFIEDNGAGFDPAYAERLFAPFQRLHGPSEFPGTGIGLATVKRIVDRHGGRVWAEGRVNGGATIYWTLAAPAALTSTERSSKRPGS
jgi:signal transduction histidine kinase